MEENVYLASSIKRVRRGQMEILRIKKAIYDLLSRERPMTCRQIFYRLVSTGIIDKTEAEYDGTVIRLLTKMRRANELPFHWIADNTRWMRKPRTFDSLEDALRNVATTYRRPLWQNQQVYVEVWLEKDALAGVLYDVTAQFDVPLMVTRGYSSVTFLHSAAKAIAYEDKPAFVYYLGDFDPSGVDISRKTEHDLRTFAPDTEIHFQRVAVTPEQITNWQLPTRPTKKTDSRAKNFQGESVEVDAISPSQLKALVQLCIEQHIDQHQLEIVRVAERSEREVLGRIVVPSAIASYGQH